MLQGLHFTPSLGLNLHTDRTCSFWESEAFMVSHVCYLPHQTTARAEQARMWSLWNVLLVIAR